MEQDSLELKKSISRLSDNQLLEMVTTNSNQYREEALTLAKAELAARGIDFSTPEVEADDADVDSDSANPSLDPDGVARLCFVCNGRLRYGTLVAEKELTIIFSDNDEERLVRVSACSRCGHISMVVGYEIDVEK